MSKTQRVYEHMSVILGHGEDDDVYREGMEIDEELTRLGGLGWRLVQVVPFSLAADPETRLARAFLVREVEARKDSGGILGYHGAIR